MAVTDSMQDVVPERSAGKGSVLKLSPRDVEDAKRLLSLFATLEDRITLEPPPRSSTNVTLDKQALLMRARELVANRRLRQEIFGKAMFSEYAWDMLLLLYVFDSGARQSIGGISDLAGATKSTGLRWIEYLEKHRLVTRREHPTDRRTGYIQLTDKARDAIELYLCETAGAAA